MSRSLLFLLLAGFLPGADVPAQPKTGGLNTVDAADFPLLEGGVLPDHFALLVPERVEEIPVRREYRSVEDANFLKCSREESAGFLVSHQWTIAIRVDDKERVTTCLGYFNHFLLKGNSFRKFTKISVKRSA